MSTTFSIRVECYAGHRGEQIPRRFYPGEHCVEVLRVLDAWLAPDHRYFKVQGDDEAVYILRQDTESGIWVLTMFDSGLP